MHLPLHCYVLHELPGAYNRSSVVKCVDLSCNELSEITLPENLPPKLQELDLTGNPRLNLDHKTLEQLKYVIIFL